MKKSPEKSLIVELMGLTRDSIDKFVERNVSLDRQVFVKQTLENNPILLSVSSITFYCAALCQLLEKHGQLPESFTTYTQITAYIMQVYIHLHL